jgi:thiol:disulfide interchange protein DsbC
VLYVTGDAKYAFTGQLVDVANRTNLTEPALATARLSLLEQMPESKMIVFEPEGEVNHTITTFTDIDCPYCRKMHQEMATLNEQGIRVRYMLFPRAGIDSRSYEKAVSVWCADDRQRELTLAKNGADPEQRECDNPIVEHMRFAERMGLTGTPLTITDTGDKIGGYMPANDLAERLDVAKQSL